MNLCHGDIKIFTGNSNRALAERISEEIGIKLGQCEIGKFSDGEIYVDIAETVRGLDIFLIQSTCTPVNESLMELLILIDAVKRASAGRINAVIPYYGYARQDRKAKAREPITAKLVADLLERAGADRIVTMDLHAAQIQGYFDKPVDHLSGMATLAECFKGKISKDAVVVSPDVGGVRRARSFANILDLPIAIIEKRRPKANVSEIMNVIGEIEGKDVILIDDIVDTAGTITTAANVLKDFGANRVMAAATHAVLSGPAIERIEKSDIEKFIVLDTIPLSEEKMIDKIEIASVAGIFGETIRRIHNNKSVSKLFE